MHSNFSLDTALFFYRHRLFTDYKMTSVRSLDDLQENLTISEFNYVMDKINNEIKEFDENNTKWKSKIVV